MPSTAEMKQLEQTENNPFSTMICVQYEELLEFGPDSTVANAAIRRAPV